MKNLSLSVSLTSLLLLATSLSILPLRINQPDWVQMSMFEQAFRGFDRFTAVKDRVTGELKKDGYESLLPQFRPSEHSAVAKNIILVFIEGLSQYHVESGLTKNIAKFQSEAYTTKNFIANQRQTNRGLYTSLCGRYPNLISSVAKSDIVSVYGSLETCLPKILAQSGIDTVFMQSAPLAFMSKDRFGYAIGYDRVIGNEHFGKAYFRSRWGIDDKSLFKYAKLEIDRLQEQGRPWFMSLLTSGTHHPYAIPSGSGSFEEALKYADESFGYFYNELRKTGILKESLLIVTSDEANTTASQQNLNMISDNRGFFAAFGGTLQTPKEISTLHSLVDIPATVVDALGVKSETKIFGQSLLKQEKTFQPILFANTYQKKAFKLEDDRLVTCNRDLQCQTYSLSEDIWAKGAFSETVKEDSFGLKKEIQFNDITSQQIKTPILFFQEPKHVLNNSQFSAFEQLRSQVSKGESIGYELTIDNRLPESSEDVELEILHHECGNPKVSTISHSIKKGEIKTISSIRIDIEKNMELCQFLRFKTKNTSSWFLRQAKVYRIN